ncbi:carbohydrate ABC transporter permease [Paenibacillus sp. J2TS4]|uniref:carbohydrate ABC transporter permease n=1 Tax=Paenibacillus sp. J2TS4 TaxID=2807194 RepID=UPI001B24BD76|nr:sugar ABC transporter permease [Paenibacillus sp. J2TS4]GIP32244.1 ABC transporter permease [Paenibacillus sp. J2TS4]
MITNKATFAPKVSFWRREWRALKKNRTAYFFIAPLVITVCCILLYPIFKAALMSFQYWYIAKPIGGHPFVGLQNYVGVVKSDYFFTSLGITGIYLAVTVIARFLLGLGTALLLNKKFAGRSLARALIIIPWAMSEVVTCLIFVLMYDYQYGIINHILMSLHLIDTPLSFLGEGNLALNAAMLVNIWKGFPFVALMLLAGLQSIPDDLYEAATMDGASIWRKFLHVTMPMLRPVSMIVFLLLVVWTLRDFALVYVLTGGGPNRATEIFSIFVYRSGFDYYKFGEAAAGGMILLVFSLIFTFIYLKASKAGESAS